MKAEPVEEELLLKSIKTKKFEKPEARIKRPIQAENSQVGMFYKTSGPFFSAASELKENKNITNFYDDKVEEEDEPFVSEILNNPEQKAFAGNPLQAAKLRKKNRLESNAQGTGNDIEKLLDQFKNTHQQIMRKVEEKVFWRFKYRLVVRLLSCHLDERRTLSTSITLLWKGECRLDKSSGSL